MCTHTHTRTHTHSTHTRTHAHTHTQCRIEILQAVIAHTINKTSDSSSSSSVLPSASHTLQHNPSPHPSTLTHPPPVHTSTPPPLPTPTTHSDDQLPPDSHDRVTKMNADSSSSSAARCRGKRRKGHRHPVCGDVMPPEKGCGHSHTSHTVCGDVIPSEKGCGHSLHRRRAVDVKSHSVGGTAVEDGVDLRSSDKENARGSRAAELVTQRETERGGKRRRETERGRRREQRETERGARKKLEAERGGRKRGRESERVRESDHSSDGHARKQLKCTSSESLNDNSTPPPPSTSNDDAVAVADETVIPFNESPLPPTPPEPKITSPATTAAPADGEQRELLVTSHAEDVVSLFPDSELHGSDVAAEREEGELSGDEGDTDSETPTPFDINFCPPTPTSSPYKTEAGEKKRSRGRVGERREVDRRCSVKSCFRDLELPQDRQRRRRRPSPRGRDERYPPPRSRQTPPPPFPGRRLRPRNHHTPPPPPPSRHLPPPPPHHRSLYRH